jgi:hypothetical protein
MTASTLQAAMSNSTVSSGAYWGPSVGQYIGHFSGVAGTRYELRARSLATVPELQLTNPHLQIVRLHFDYLRVWGSQLVGLALGAASAATLAVGTVKRIRRAG